MRYLLLIALAYIAWRLLHGAVRRKIARMRGETVAEPPARWRPIDLVAIGLLVIYGGYTAWHIWTQTG